MSESPRAVFLSYAREDAATAKHIAEALRGFGVEVWFDLSELRGGDQWDQKIRGQIKACALFMPVISTTTQSRDEAYFRLEWKLADDRSHLMASGKVFILPIAVDDTPENGAAVPDSFSRAQWIRLPGGAPTPQFVEQVKRLLAGPAASAGSGSRPPAAGLGDPARQKKSGRSGWIFAAGVAVVAAIAVAVYVGRKPEAAAPIAPAPVAQPAAPAAVTLPKANSKSIAVLPFENRSEAKADAFFTDGIHDDLLTQIARFKDIKTISRTSVMAYKNTTKNMRTIGQELGVATILEGGVQRAGNQVRINMQLIDARTDEHLWAETYTREMTAENIFSIQSEIAAAIAKALSAVLSPEEQQQLEHRATASLAALEQYFAANALARDQNTDKLARAVPLYLEAIRLDPAFAPAYARLAYVYLDQIQLSGLPTELQLRKVEPLVARALELDPRLSEAHEARGYLLVYRDDFPGAKAAYERAIELKPNSDRAYLGLALTLFWQDGSLREQGLTLARRAQELSPEDPNVNRVIASFLIDMGRTAEGRVMVEKLIRENPQDALSMGLLGYLQINDGKLLEGFVTLRKAYALDPGSAPTADGLLQQSIDVLGDKEWVDFWLERSVASTRVGKVPLDTRLRLLISKGQLVEADALWNEEWRTDPRSHGVVLWELMLADVKAGRKAAPRKRYLQINPELFVAGAKPVDTSNGLFRAKDVALSLIAVGERGPAEQLLAEAEKLARGHTDWIYSFILAKIQLARGDRAAFFQTLRSMVAMKEAVAYIFNDPEFGVYREDPEFLALFGDLPRQRAELIATLHRMDASGELAPVPPLPGSKK
jgi:TolB-like protein/Tfp pilus assembly protein PilF